MNSIKDQFLTYYQQSNEINRQTRNLIGFNNFAFKQQPGIFRY